MPPLSFHGGWNPLKPITQGETYGDFGTYFVQVGINSDFHLCCVGLRRAL